MAEKMPRVPKKGS